MTGSTDWAWDQVAEASRETITPSIRSALLANLTKHDHLYAGDRLRVGADLKPDGEGCDRATYYRLKGVASDPPQLARRLRYERGRWAQKIFAEALRESGVEVEDEVACRPLRPTAWAWDSGHGDVLDVTGRHLYEVKAPGLDAWRRSRGMPQKLVREAYRYQLSFYFHELQRTGRVDSASWIFMDMEGEFDPVEVHLHGDLLVPLSEIVNIEASKNNLMWATDPPPRPANTVSVVKVLKGGRKTKKNPKPERQVFAVDRRFWACAHCNYLSVCQPGPEETEVTLAPNDPRRIAAVREAEAEWAAEDADKKTSAVAASSQQAASDVTPAASDRAGEVLAQSPSVGSGSHPSKTEGSSAPGRRASDMVVLSETLGPSVTKRFLDGPGSPGQNETTETLPSPSPAPPPESPRSTGVAENPPTAESPPSTKREHVYEKRDDGLASCSVCKGGEGSLPSECPGVAMNGTQQREVYAGHLDYRDGRWIDPKGGDKTRWLDRAGAELAAAGGTDDELEPDPSWSADAPLAGW